MISKVSCVQITQTKLNSIKSHQMLLKRKSIFSHHPPGLQSMGEFALGVCLFTSSIHWTFFQALLRRGGTSTIHTLKKKCFKIGEPAELQIGHIGDAIMTQMQHLQAAHQWLQAGSGPSFPKQSQRMTV